MNNIKCGAIWRTLLEMLIPLTAILMFVTAVTRYVFSYSPAWMNELTGFLHAIAFLGLAGYALRDDKHVRIDILAGRLGSKGRRCIDAAGFFLLLMPYCAAIAYFSTDFILASWRLHEGSREYMGMPGVFLLKTMIWAYALVLISDGFRTLVLKKKEPLCS